ncbi:FAD-dependent oxidoreductase [Dactylosporangium aurantiacum]|uniref:FAD-dependent oxidoreductase n=1 Tax=Dactylosporangium aurantiacum TaxID=35754 RepID=A0A9Q9I926_9ACTN|nr:FAD-dependent oxidoreductase [Dactylosporangium aurantiacum]MDG6103428.1 FAD-dependent oxidoreductase [Dactylosporangium aurantiacum]UWZ52064.1 FAD-dependent oxidoreductase [Dactylosporangium aurantiacum]
MTSQADVVVVGGGLGGVAAAIAAARAGMTVILTEELDRVGGQLTTQLVSALDEHPHVETFGVSAAYRQLRDRIRAACGGAANPGDGWVSRLCFPPAVGQRVLDALLAEHGVQVRLHSAPQTVTVDGDTVTAVTFTDGTRLTAPVFIDATERGDLLPLAGEHWSVGSEGTDAHGEPFAVPGGPAPQAQQSFTWCALLTYHPDRDGDDPGPAPARYDELRQHCGLDIAGWDGGVHRYRMFTDGPDGKPPFWTYRRLRTGTPELIVLNWASNDCAGYDPIGDGHTAERAGRELTAAFIHWLRTEAPREDGGRGYPGLRLAAADAGTVDGYAAAPYLRESRRLRNDRPVTGHDLLPVPGRARARHLPGSVGVAWYHIDLHERTGHPAPVYQPTAPFTIPAHALVGRVGNLLMGAKNLAATQIAAAAYRVHHGEWAVGEAAGALAAVACATNRTARDVVDTPALLVTAQLALARHAVPLAWIADVAADDPLFPAAHLLAAHGALEADLAADLRLRPDETPGTADLAALHGAAATVRDSLGLPGPAVAPAPAAAATSTWREHATAALAVPR